MNDKNRTIFTNVLLILAIAGSYIVPYVLPRYQTPFVPLPVVPVVVADIDGPAVVDQGGFKVYSYTKNVQSQKWTVKHLCINKDCVEVHELKEGEAFYVDYVEKKLILATNVIGKYILRISGLDGKNNVDAELIVEIRGAQPPPEPEPEPKPVPPKPDVVVGPKNIVIFRESKDTTHEFARTISLLRSGEPAEYLKSKKHSLYILDVDTRKGDGQQPKVVQDWLPTIKGMQLPCMVIFDPTTNKLVHKQELSANATADQVVVSIKGNGG